MTSHHLPRVHSTEKITRPATQITRRCAHHQAFEWRHLQNRNDVTQRQQSAVVTKTIANRIDPQIRHCERRKPRNTVKLHRHRLKVVVATVSDVSWRTNGARAASTAPGDRSKHRWRNQSIPTMYTGWFNEDIKFMPGAMIGTTALHGYCTSSFMYWAVTQERARLEFWQDSHKTNTSYKYKQ